MIGTDDLPELVPARMVNEFVYCPRLCYLEWAQQRWEPNDDTAAGAFRHHSTDAKGGVLPDAAAGDHAPLSTFSVTMSDEGWGLTGVIDRIDHTADGAVPVDLKKGHPRADGTPWPADRIQALCQAALLEANGFRVTEAHLSYDEGHCRVAVPWDDPARRDLTAVLADLRTALCASVAPLPLLDDPRCPRCSLSGLCLPDELNSILHRSEAEPRRILARNPDSAPLYVVEQGAVVGVKAGRIRVTVKGELRADVRLIDVQHLCVLGHVQVTTEALTRLWSAGASVTWLSTGGWLNGWSQAHPGKYVDLRRQQVVHAAQGGEVASALIRGKIRNQRTLLRRNAKRPVPSGVIDTMRELADAAGECREIHRLLGFEGTAARLYFKHFGAMLSDPNWAGSFSDVGRTRRPPTDPVNAVLGFCYSLLTKDLVIACLAVGLDPYLGVLHRPRYGRPAMALDLAEEFRALVADSVTINVFNNREVGPGDFVTRNAGVQLTTEGRRAVLAAYERRMAQEIKHPTFGYRVTYRRCLEVQTRLMAALFVGETDSYPPLITR